MIKFSQTEMLTLIKILHPGEKDCPPIINEILEKIHTELKFEEQLGFLVKEAPYELSENQEQFVRDCLALDLMIEWDYSGRGMNGRKCPCVRINDAFLRSFADVARDNMGMGYVHYAKY